MTGSVTTAAMGTTTSSAIGSRLSVGMRFIAVFAIVIAGRTFAQQPDPAVSGVLVASPPASFHENVRKALLNAPNWKAPKPQALQEKARLCAIPVLSAAALDHIDDGIFVKDIQASVDKPFL